MSDVSLVDVRLVEVGPRDGLQNETTQLSVAQRLELIERLVRSGLQHIEVGSFVSPRWVPQMSDSDQVLQQLNLNPAFTQIHFPVLTPNLTGYQAAHAAGAKEIAIFGSASETFSQKNINCSINESLMRFRHVTEQAKADGVAVRGYVSCITACPYEGNIHPEQVVPVVRRLFELGCYEVSLGDTIGRATPKAIHRLLDALRSEFSVQQLALHCHNTYGMAIANIMAGLEQGIRTFDSSVGGAGGCPYAHGASGNIATEEVVYLMQQEGLNTGIDLNALVHTGRWLFWQLDKKVCSKVAEALGG